MIRAAGFDDYGSAEVLKVFALPMPQLEPGEVLVRVRYATVNPTDTSFRSGAHRDRMARMRPPFVPGVELVGEVVAFHPGAEKFAVVEVGQYAIGYVSPYGHGGGAYAEYVAVDARSLVPVPRTMEHTLAAALPMNGVTSLLSLELLALAPGDTLLVTGGPGALGSYVISIARNRGIKVLADGYESDEPYLSALGADVIPRGDGMFEAVSELVPRGLDGILDGACIGNSLTQLVRPGGVYAAVRGEPGKYSKEGVICVRVSAREQMLNTSMLQHVTDLADRGIIHPRVSRVLELEMASEAHAALEAGGLRGRQLLKMGT